MMGFGASVDKKLWMRAEQWFIRNDSSPAPFSGLLIRPSGKDAPVLADWIMVVNPSQAQSSQLFGLHTGAPLPKHSPALF